MPYEKILLILCIALKFINNFVKKKKGNKLGRTILPKTEIPFVVEAIYTLGFRIITAMINKIIMGIKYSFKS